MTYLVVGGEFLPAQTAGLVKPSGGVRLGHAVAVFLVHQHGRVERVDVGQTARPALLGREIGGSDYGSD